MGAVENFRDIHLRAESDYGWVRLLSAIAVSLFGTSLGMKSIPEEGS